MLGAGVYLLVVRQPDRPSTTALIGAGLLTAAIWGLFTLAISYGGPTLWFYVRHIPGGTAIRCVARVHVIVYLFGILSALVWLGTITAQLGPATRSLVLGFIAAFVIFEQCGVPLPRYDKQEFYPVVERTAEQLRGAEAAYVIPRMRDAHGEPNSIASDTMAMWAGLRANVPVVNGYSGRAPSEDYPTASPVDDASLRKWLRDKFHGKLTIVDPDDPGATRVIVIE
jgi:hypothetical protein